MCNHLYSIICSCMLCSCPFVSLLMKQVPKYGPVRGSHLGMAENKAETSDIVHTLFCQEKEKLTLPRSCTSHHDVA